MFEPIIAKQPPANFFTQTIEDCLIYLSNAHDSANWEWPAVNVQMFDTQITKSLGMQLHNGSPFTEKQSHIGLRLVKKYKSLLKEAGFDADKIYDEKIFKNPFRVIDKTRALYINGDTVVCKSNFIPDLVNSFKKRKSNPYHSGDYNADDKTWAFSLNEDNVEFLCDAVKGKKFTIEDPIQTCFEKIKHIKKQALDFDKFYPHLDIKDNKYYIKNSPIDIEINQTDNVREAIFDARRYGITIFSDAVVDSIQDKTSLDRIMYESHSNWATAQSTISKEATLDIIKSTKTTVIMVSSYAPDDLIDWMEILDKNNIDTCVAFRFKKNPDTNKMIKDYKMNSYNPNCNVIIINEKIPKTFLQDSINPDLILVNLSTPPGHYKTQIWLDSKSLIVYTSGTKSIKDKHHGVL